MQAAGVLRPASVPQHARRHPVPRDGIHSAAISGGSEPCLDRLDVASATWIPALAGMTVSARGRQARPSPNPLPQAGEGFWGSDPHRRRANAAIGAVGPLSRARERVGVRGFPKSGIAAVPDRKASPRRTGAGTWRLRQPIPTLCSVDAANPLRFGRSPPIRRAFHTWGSGSGGEQPFDRRNPPVSRTRLSPRRLNR